MCDAWICPVFFKKKKGSRAAYDVWTRHRAQRIRARVLHPPSTVTVVCPAQHGLLKYRW